MNKSELKQNYVNKCAEIGDLAIAIERGARELKDAEKKLLGFKDQAANLWIQIQRDEVKEPTPIAKAPDEILPPEQIVGTA